MAINYRQPFRGSYPITQCSGGTDTSAYHTGIDYGCPLGTEILASAEGIVRFAGWDNYGYGKCVIIQHLDFNATLYAHLSEILVKVGEKVTQGQLIGLSGSTGNSTGPHLHFEARKVWNGYTTHFDPMSLPMRSVDDSIPHTEQTNGKDLIPEGICEIVCTSAWVRDWENIERSYTINHGEKFSVFPDVKFRDGLPYRFIGANRCIAEYDQYGTQIIGKVE